MRIDKWLWTVRAYKTRGDAAEACRVGRVAIGDGWAKASREVREGDVVSVRKGPATLSFRVLDMPSGRVGAKDVPRFAEDVTPAGEREKLVAMREGVGVLVRDRGAGRPTKKERRDIEELMDGLVDE